MWDIFSQIQPLPVKDVAEQPQNISMFHSWDDVLVCVDFIVVPMNVKLTWITESSDFDSFILRAISLWFFFLLLMEVFSF